VGVCCEHGNEPLGFIKGEELLDYVGELASQEGLFHGVCSLARTKTQIITLYSVMCLSAIECKDL
jgi:hypothetical protein